jgi:hypothetical protein
MKFKLLEDNKSIIKDIEHLDKLIVELRTTKGLDESLKKELILVYDKNISPWMKKYYLLGKETPINKEQEMTELIINTIITVSSLLKHK